MQATTRVLALLAVMAGFVASGPATAQDGLNATLMGRWQMATFGDRGGWISGSGDFAYVGSHAGLHVLDVSDSSAPVEISSTASYWTSRILITRSDLVT